MDFKVIFRDTFNHDLEEIVKKVALQNPAAAKMLGESIIRTGESLCFFPERFPRLRQRPGVRRFLVLKYYKTFYRVHSDLKIVEILRCWDGRRGTDPFDGSREER